MTSPYFPCSGQLSENVPFPSVWHIERMESFLNRLTNAPLTGPFAESTVPLMLWATDRLHAVSRKYASDKSLMCLIKFCFLEKNESIYIYIVSFFYFFTNVMIKMVYPIRNGVHLVHTSDV